MEILLADILLFILAFISPLWAGGIIGKNNVAERMEKKLKRTKSKKRYYKKLLRMLQGVPDQAPELIGLITIPASILLAIVLDSAWAVAGAIPGFLIGTVIRHVADRQFKNRKKQWKETLIKEKGSQLAIESLADLENDETQTFLKTAIIKLEGGAFGRLLRGLKGLDKELVEPILVAGLKHPRETRRMQVLASLAWHHPSTVFKYMKPWTDKNNVEIRKLTYSALRHLPHQQAEPWIKKGLADKEFEVRQEVNTVKDILELKKTWPHWSQPETQEKYAEFEAELERIHYVLEYGSWEEIYAYKVLMNEAGFMEWKILLETVKTAGEAPIMVSVAKLLGNKPVGETYNLALLNLMLHRNEQVVDAVREALKQREDLPLKAIRIRLEKFEPGLKMEFLRLIPTLQELPIDELKMTLSRALLDPEEEVQLVALETVRTLGKTELLPIILQYCRYFPPEGKVGAKKPKVLAGRQTANALFAQLPAHGKDTAHLFCTECLTRANTKEQSGWTFAVCRRCDQYHTLIPDIEQIVGLVGPKFEEERQAAGELRLELWNEKRKTARYADVDRVEIHGGADFNYDWAVNAVLQELKNGDHPNYDAIPKNMVNNPALDVNTQRMLRESP